MKHYFLISLLSAAAILISAQKPGGDCKTNLMSYAKSMSGIQEPAEKKTYHMKYSVETIYKPGKSANASKYVSADILVAKGKSFYETDIMSMYADDKNGFLVLPLQKKIIWGPGGKNLTSKQNFDALSGFEDSLIRFSNVISCRMVDENKESLQETVLDPPQSIKTGMNVKRVTMLFSPEKKVVRQVIIIHEDRSEIDRIIVTYQDIDFDYKGTIKETAFEKVFNKNGKPKPIYKDYEIIDNRETN